jgi:hypothetical protein
MRRQTLIIVALLATACALEDEAPDDHALESEALDDPALDDEVSALEASGGQPGAEGAASSAASSAPVCNGSAPPGSGWVLDSSYASPSACRKCQEAGRRLEASGRWRTHCMLLGGIGPALLFRFCVACLNGEAAAAGPDGAVSSEKSGEREANEL